jgi:hypothetical protein
MKSHLMIERFNMHKDLAMAWIKCAASAANAKNRAKSIRCLESAMENIKKMQDVIGQIKEHRRLELAND